MLFSSKSPIQTQKLAQRLSGYLKSGDIVALYGGLGTGKTVFVKGLAKGLGVKKDEVSSPSFVLVREYKGKIPLYHFDLYRLKRLKEIYDLIQEYFSKDGVTVIEWAKRARALLPKSYLAIDFKFKNETTRKILLRPFGARYKNIIGKFKHSCVY